MNASPRGFAARAARAARDKNLRRVMRQAVLHLEGLRAQAVDPLPDLEERRDRAAATRSRALASLADNLETLERRFTENGGRVHFARDAAEAVDIIGRIALAGGVRRVVKGKSMVTEEIGLNAHLESLGLTVHETDLGEYIVQLAGQGPSHIISPALHLSKEEVSDLFQEKLGRTGKTIPEMTMVARETLRQAFLAADMGVTGVNVAVAGIGALALVENEGNIRLSACCPRIHVAVMTVEKVVADLADLADIIDVLPRFATGQDMPRSLSLFFGPRRPGEADGPEEAHLVIVDNGRSRLLADPDLGGMLACIRCGSCLNVCPVYAVVGGHAYGYAYSGPIGMLLAGGLLPVEESASLAFACTMCGACAEACPARVNHPKMLLELRRRAARVGRSPLPDLLARAYAKTLENPALFRAVAVAVRRLDPGLALAARLPGLDGLRAYLSQRQGPRLTEPFDPGASGRPA